MAVAYNPADLRAQTAIKHTDEKIKAKQLAKLAAQQKPCAYCEYPFVPSAKSPNYPLCSDCAACKIECANEKCGKSFTPFSPAFKYCPTCAKAHKAKLVADWEQQRKVEEKVEKSKEEELKIPKKCEKCAQVFYYEDKAYRICTGCGEDWQKATKVRCTYTNNHLLCSNFVFYPFPRNLQFMEKGYESFQMNTVCGSAHYHIDNPKQPDVKQAAVAPTKSKTQIAAELAQKKAKAKLGDKKKAPKS